MALFTYALHSAGFVLWLSARIHSAVGDNSRRRWPDAAREALTAAFFCQYCSNPNGRHSPGMFEAAKNTPPLRSTCVFGVGAGRWGADTAEGHEIYGTYGQLRLQNSVFQREALRNIRVDPGYQVRKARRTSNIARFKLGLTPQNQSERTSAVDNTREQSWCTINLRSRMRFYGMPGVCL